MKSAGNPRDPCTDQKQAEVRMSKGEAAEQDLQTKFTFFIPTTASLAVYPLSSAFAIQDTIYYCELGMLMGIEALSPPRDGLAYRNEGCRHFVGEP